MKRIINTILSSCGQFLWGSSITQRAAHAHYIACVNAARNPFFYTHCEVADDVYGRYEMLLLHLSLLLQRMQHASPHFDRLRLAIVEAFFEDMEHEMREMGVSDLRVGSKVKNCVSVLYGRYNAYDAALESPEILAQTLAHNVFCKSGTPSENGLLALAHYVHKAHAHLQNLSDIALEHDTTHWRLLSNC